MSDPSLPSGERKAATVRSLFDRIGPRYDLVNRVMTFGMDVGWRRRAIRELHLPPASRVFDLACGTGDLCRELRRAGHRPIGFDFAFGMLANARTDAATTGPISDTDWRASGGSVMIRSIVRKWRASVAAAFSPTWRMPSA